MLLLQQNKFDKFEKKLSFGGYYILKTVYYLCEHPQGLRIEVSKFTRTMTAEVLLVMGDDKLIKKRVYLRKAIPSATKKQVDRTVEDFTKWAEKHLMKNKKINTEGSPR